MEDSSKPGAVSTSKKSTKNSKKERPGVTEEDQYYYYKEYCRLAYSSLLLERQLQMLKRDSQLLQTRESNIKVSIHFQRIWPPKISQSAAADLLFF